MTGLWRLLGILGLCGCALFDGPVNTKSLPYRKELLWANPTLQTVGQAGFDDSSVYVLSVRADVLRLDRRTGDIRWTQPTQRYSSANRLDRVGSAVIVASGVFSAFDALSGTPRWQSTNPEDLGSMPFAVFDTLLLPSTYRSKQGIAYALTPNQELRWQSRIFPADSVVGATDQVRVFRPDVSQELAAYSYAWFIGASALAPTKGGVALVDPTTGAVKWSTLIEPTYANEQTFPSDAAIGRNGVYVSTKGGRVYGFSLVDGKRKWFAKGTRGFNGEPENTYDFRPVTAVANTVVAGSGLEVAQGFDEVTGEMVWSRNTENSGIANIERFGSEAVLLHHYSGGLTLLEATTGRLLWIFQPRNGNNGFTAIRVVGDTVLATSLSGNTQAFRLVKR